MDKKKWKIGLVEDQQVFIDHFRDILKDDPAIEEISEKFWSDSNKFSLDLLFIDIILPNMNGIDLANLITEELAHSAGSLDLKMVVITTVNSDEIIFKALKAGAVGYIYKDEIYDLKGNIKQIISGGAIISPTIALRILNNFTKDSKKEDFYALTTREKQILEQMVKGYTMKKASLELGISSNTMRNHVYNIYKKLNIKNKAELMKKASKMGFF